MGGIIFFGTPHTEDSSAALLQAARATVEGFSRPGHTIPESEVREFVSAVGRVNSAFRKSRPAALKMRSYWEEEPTEIRPVDGEPYKTMVCSIATNLRHSHQC
jgi:hypothetical protein